MSSLDQRANARRLLATTPVREASEADLPFMVAIAEECYPGRGVVAGIEWMKRCIGSGNNLVLVGEHSIGVAQINLNYGYEKRAKMVLLASRKTSRGALETLHMLRIMLVWAKALGATGEFALSSDTGVDFAAFAKRLGGRRIDIVEYRIPLGKEQE